MDSAARLMIAYNVAVLQKSSLSTLLRIFLLSLIGRKKRASRQHLSTSAYKVARFPVNADPVFAVFSLYLKE